jgi:NitT/TauT family transport system ATP-binding protein
MGLAELAPRRAPLPSGPATAANPIEREVALECERLAFAYVGKGREVVALDGVDVRLHAGELLCCVGPSGCGKSTLLKLFAGLLRPSAGSVRRALRADGGAQRISLVFQEHGLFPWMRVIDNVAFALEAQGVPRPERLRRARELIASMDLVEFASFLPHELSVGMRQRVGLARALLSRPDLLLLDEPFASVDALNRHALREELLAVWQRERLAMIYVTHDLEEAVLLGDRVLVMSGRPGRILLDLRVSLPRPRERSAADVARLAQEIWELLSTQVRRELHLEP